MLDKTKIEVGVEIKPLLKKLKMINLKGIERRSNRGITAHIIPSRYLDEETKKDLLEELSYSNKF